MKTIVKHSEKNIVINVFERKDFIDREENTMKSSERMMKQLNFILPRKRIIISKDGLTNFIDYETRNLVRIFKRMLNDETLLRKNQILLELKVKERHYCSKITLSHVIKDLLLYFIQMITPDFVIKYFGLKVIDKFEHIQTAKVYNEQSRLNISKLKTLSRILFISDNKTSDFYSVGGRVNENLIRDNIKKCLSISFKLTSKEIIVLTNKILSDGPSERLGKEVFFNLFRIESVIYKKITDDLMKEKKEYLKRLFIRNETLNDIK